MMSLTGFASQATKATLLTACSISYGMPAIRYTRNTSVLREWSALRDTTQSKAKADAAATAASAGRESRPLT